MAVPGFVDPGPAPAVVWPGVGFCVDPALGFVDPALGFVDPVPGFVDPVPGFVDPGLGFVDDVVVPVPLVGAAAAPVGGMADANTAVGVLAAPAVPVEHW